MNQLSHDVDVTRLRADVEELCRTQRNSREDTESHRRAAAFVADSLKSAGCSVSKQEFTIADEREPRPGTNVVGTLEPTQDNPGDTAPAILVGSHYDTVPGSPGADDNASGVAAMLECARLLSQFERTCRLIFACFDAEERQPNDGLHGSTAYVKSLVDKDETSTIAAAYILEMVGFSAPKGEQKVPPGLQLAFPRAFDRLARSGFRGDSVVVISNWKSRFMSRMIESHAISEKEGVPVLPVEIQRGLPVPHNLLRSDHAPFWDAGIPAVMIGDTANFRNPNYHMPSDTPDSLDFEFMKKNTAQVASVVAKHVRGPVSSKGRKVRLR